MHPRLLQHPKQTLKCRRIGKIIPSQQLESAFFYFYPRADAVFSTLPPLSFIHRQRTHSLTLSLLLSCPQIVTAGIMTSQLPSFVGELSKKADSNYSPDLLGLQKRFKFFEKVSMRIIVFTKKFSFVKFSVLQYFPRVLVWPQTSLAYHSLDGGSCPLFLLTLSCRLQWGSE